MKKFVALLLTLVLTFSLAACGAEGGVKDNEAANYLYPDYEQLQNVK